MATRPDFKSAEISIPPILGAPLVGVAIVAAGSSEADTALGGLKSIPQR
jgi:hypothetical protein